MGLLDFGELLRERHPTYALPVSINYRNLSIDAVDRLIIDQLRIDGRQSFASVGSKIGLSEPTVRVRYNRLVKLGIMQVVGMVSKTKIGEIEVLGFLRIIGTSVESVCQKLYEIPEITFIAECVGEYDVCLDIRCIDEDHWNITHALIERIPNVDASEFFRLNEVIKEQYLWQGLSS